MTEWHEWVMGALAVGVSYWAGFRRGRESMVGWRVRMGRIYAGDPMPGDRDPVRRAARLMGQENADD